jgi:hypothetical protein
LATPATTRIITESVLIMADSTVGMVGEMAEGMAGEMVAAAHTKE